ncbi:MAG: transcriptional regulator [Halonotius sp. J07HN6]|nr:MAG: transcriptional regulator [Halonotius sp. J07HN6]
MTYQNLDAKLINALLDNGRASLRSLSEGLDVSVTTVSNHIHDLESDGVINGYAPVVDYDALGYDVTAVIQLKVEGDALPDIANRLREKPRMVSVYEVTGDHDIVAIGKFEDTDDMDDRIKQLLTDTEIRETNTSIVLNAAAEHDQFDLVVDDAA